MTKEEFFSILEKYERQACTDAEISIVDQFFDAFEQEASRMDAWDLSSKERIRLEIFEGMRKRIKPASTTKTRVFSARFIKVAATILLVAAVGYLVPTLVLNQNELTEIEYITKTTRRGQRATVTLTDGTIIQLNAESSITYPSAFSDTLRKVVLTGEAFFEVNHQPERPFTVEAGAIETRVLGTSFNVSAYPEETLMEVTLASGKVAVRALNQVKGAPLLLDPSEQAQFEGLTGELTKQTVDLSQSLAWRENLIILDMVTLEEATKILGRWYDLNFTFENEAIKSCIVNGEFKSDRPENILENIQFLTGIEYRIESANNVILNGKPCNE